MRTDKADMVCGIVVCSGVAGFIGWAAYLIATIGF